MRHTRPPTQAELDAIEAAWQKYLNVRPEIIIDPAQIQQRLSKVNAAYREYLDTLDAMGVINTITGYRIRSIQREEPLSDWPAGARDNPIELDHD